MDVDDDLLDARGTQPVEHMVDQRLAGDLDQRLGRVAVSGRMRLPSPAAMTIAVFGTSAATSARSRKRTAGGGHAASCHGAARCSGATLASNQSRTGSSPG